MNQRRNNNMWSLLLGMAAGAAAVYFSDKKNRDKAKEKFEELKVKGSEKMEDIKGKVKEGAEKAETELEEIKEKMNGNDTEI